MIFYKINPKVTLSQNNNTSKKCVFEAIGRAGIVEVEISIENEEPVKVRIFGEAVIVFQSELII